MNKHKSPWQNPIFGVGAVLLLLAGCAAHSDNTLSSEEAPKGQEQVFETADDAVDALVAANRNDDKEALLKILGPNGEKIISSGDPVADQENRDRFLRAYDIGHSLESENGQKQILVVGEEEWPLPIPLVSVGSYGWRFDTEAGEEEILNRRIGRNELNVIEVCRTYVEAQREFAEQHPLQNGQLEYAQHFMSSPGKHNGLYWEASPSEEESPLGPLFANARDEGYTVSKSHEKRQPYHGYFYRILNEQGASAADGSKKYVHNGHMTEGFALIAYPAKYGDSGVMTFIVNQYGIVFEKNLGPDTTQISKHITIYNPDASWTIAADE